MLSRKIENKCKCTNFYSFLNFSYFLDLIQSFFIHTLFHSYLEVLDITLINQLPFYIYTHSTFLFSKSFNQFFLISSDHLSYIFKCIMIFITIWFLNCFLNYWFNTVKLTFDECFNLWCLPFLFIFFFHLKISYHIDYLM